MTASTDALVQACVGCSTELGPAMLACPACGRLVHGPRLEALRQRAEHPDTSPRDALAAWREARALVPEGSRQAIGLDERIADAARAVDRSPLGRDLAKPLSGLLAVGLLAWKFKALLLLGLSKAKLLLLGFTKIGTLSTMALSFGVYGSAFGWPFAAGLVLSIYVHEMGHVIALSRYGIPASAPMFIPGLGAFVRLKAAALSPREDARTGLAGPLYGLGAALACLAVGTGLDSPLFLALARVGAYLNLFNLLPVWQLDGARGLRALAKHQRLAVAATALAAFALTGEGLLLLIAGIAGARAFEATPDAGDRGATGGFAGLVAALAWLAHTPSPV